MRVSALIAALEEFQAKLVEHRDSWDESPDEDDALATSQKLQEQSRWLSRKLGALRPYIERFDRSWIMEHPATGVRWDVLEAATGLTAIPQVKGPSISSAIQKIDQILGFLENFDEAEKIPSDPSKPMRSGITADRIMLAYLDHLHPFIARGCSQLYQDGHYAQAVEEAAKAVFQYVRDLTSLKGDGASLVQTAFSVKNPILAFSDLADETKKNEQLGFMEMLCAFTKGVRHPLAHTHGRFEDAQNAFEYLVMASLFCRRIDDAAPKTVSSLPT